MEKLSTYQPALSAPELRQKISALGVKKANTKVWQLLILGILAGLYISLAGHIYMVALEQGMGKIVGGLVFGVGLVLVVLAGAELFTGNVMMLVSTMLSLCTIRKILKNWVSVCTGNFVGSMACALLIWQSGLFGHPGDPTSLGSLAIGVAAAKLKLTFTEAFIRGIFCNILVVLAIILGIIAKDVISKIVALILPVMLFVGSGFEHCIANMYLIPAGLLAGGTAVADLGQMFTNIIPVTLGNLVGGIFILAIHPNRIAQMLYIAKNRQSIEEQPAED